MTIPNRITLHISSQGDWDVSEDTMVDDFTGDYDETIEVEFERVPALEPYRQELIDKITEEIEKNEGLHKTIEHLTERNKALTDTVESLVSERNQTPSIDMVHRLNEAEEQRSCDALAVRQLAASCSKYLKQREILKEAIVEILSEMEDQPDVYKNWMILLNYALDKQKSIKAKKVT